MKLISREHILFNCVLVLFILLFAIAPLYTYQNQGWPSLALPFNTSGWSIASWLIALAALTISSKKVVIYPVLWSTLVLFPVIIVVNSLLADSVNPIDWLFRQLFVFGGLFYIFSLFQFDLKPTQKECLLYVVVIAVGLQALLATMQIVAPLDLPSWLSKQPNSTVPRGIFQQVNVMSTFLATGLIAIVFLVSRPSFKSKHFIIKLLLVVIFGLSFYVTTASGSRVGLLSMVVGLSVVIVFRSRQLLRQKPIAILLIVVSVLGFSAGKMGFVQTMDKAVSMADSKYASARMGMYQIGIEIVQKEPLYGHGIGSFLKQWNIQASDFYKRHPESNLPPVIEHPHNEILFWMIEGGLLAVIGILVLILGVIIAICRCGWQRGGAYAAMLFPISLHTQVEHPLDASVLHWFLWLFLLYLPFSYQVKTKFIGFSSSALNLTRLLALMLAASVTLFMWHTARAQNDLFKFIHYQEQQKPPYLNYALNNIYTRPLAESKAMAANLYSSIERKDLEGVRAYEVWAKQYVEKMPYLYIYNSMIAASATLRPEGKGCDAINAAYEMYSHLDNLQVAHQNCLKN
jgi:O-antigen polymerase